MTVKVLEVSNRGEGDPQISNLGEGDPPAQVVVQQVVVP